MPAFNFKKNTKLALVRPGISVHEIMPEQEISFSQTFTEMTQSVNTIHSPQYFERSTIVKANPASFSFTVNIYKESTGASVLFDRLIECDTFDLYFVADESIFRLQNAVLASGSFQINRNSLMKLELEGEAERLIRIASNNTNQLPQTTFNNFIATLSESYTSHPSSPTILIPDVTVRLDNTNITEGVFGISAEMQNDISWTGYDTIHQGLSVTNSSNAMYPSGFTVDKKIFSGNIRRYLEDGSDSSFMNFSPSSTLRIEAGKDYSGSFAGLDFNMPTVSFTNRVSPAELYSQAFDWRLTDNTTLSSILQYNTI